MSVRLQRKKGSSMQTTKKSKCQVEVFSRVTGFYRPVQSWNKGKTEEFRDRSKFSVPEITKKHTEKELLVS